MSLLRVPCGQDKSSGRLSSSSEAAASAWPALISCCTAAAFVHVSTAMMFDSANDTVVTAAFPVLGRIGVGTTGCVELVASGSLTFAFF